MRNFSVASEHPGHSCLPIMPKVGFGQEATGWLVQAADPLRLPAEENKKAGEVTRPFHFAIRQTLLFLITDRKQ